MKVSFCVFPSITQLFLRCFMNWWCVQMLFKWLIVTRMEAPTKQKPKCRRMIWVNCILILVASLERETGKGQKTCCQSLKLICRWLQRSQAWLLFNHFLWPRNCHRIYIWIVNIQVNREKLLAKRGWWISNLRKTQNLFIFGIESHSKCLIYCVVFRRLIMSWNTNT